MRESFFISLLLLSIILSAGCGGGTGTPSTTTGNNNPPPPPTSNGETSPTAVSVSAGRTTPSINISVTTSVSSPKPNAESLGVGTSTTNTGITVSRSSNPTIILFGHGLSAGMKVRITGPDDITVSNIRSVTATDGTPGITFTAAVASDAALGARTVVLQNAKNDITAYAGGMEVLP
jgi:hypothetical protein